MIPRRTLVVDVRVGESISLDSGRIEVAVQEKSGQRAKLRLTMNSDVSVDRSTGAAKVANVIAQSGIRWSQPDA